MLGPLVILAILSIVGGWLAAPHFLAAWITFARFWGRRSALAIPEMMLARPAVDGMAPLGVAVIAGLLGLLVAWWLYRNSPAIPRASPSPWAGSTPRCCNKYFVDELYAAVIVAPLMWISRTSFGTSWMSEIVDGAVNGIAHGAREIGDATRHTQSGNTRSYAVWVVIGAILVIAVVFWVHLQPPVLGMVR